MALPANAVCRLEELPAETQKTIFHFVARDEVFNIHDRAIGISKNGRDGQIAKLYGARRDFTVTGKDHYLAFTSPILRASYREALQEYIINDAEKILARVTNFDFRNLIRLLKIIAKQPGGLEAFRPDANGVIKRQIYIRHTTTGSLTNDIDSLIKFTKLIGSDTICRHIVEQCHDLPALEEFCSYIDTMKLEGKFLQDLESKLNRSKDQRRNRVNVGDGAPDALSDANDFFFGSAFLDPDNLPDAYEQDVQEYEPEWEAMSESDEEQNVGGEGTDGQME